MRVFVVKAFGRFAKGERIDDEVLSRAIQDAEVGRSADDLGGGVWKVRISRAGSGKSGGYRTMVALKSETRAVFLHGFGKNELDNVGETFLKDLKKQARIFLGFTDEQVQKALDTAVWREIVAQQRDDRQQDGD